MDFVDRPSIRITYERPRSPPIVIKYDAPIDSHQRTPARKKRSYNNRSKPYPPNRRPINVVGSSRRDAEQPTNTSTGPHNIFSDRNLPYEDYPRFNDDDYTSNDTPRSRSPSIARGEDSGIVLSDQDCTSFSQATLGIALDDIEFSYFVDAVASEECTFMQLCSSIFVANGWNKKKAESTVRQRSINLDISLILCDAGHLASHSERQDHHRVEGVLQLQ